MKHTNETKILLSKQRKDWLKNNPDKHPWRKKNKNISIPCENVKKYLDKNNLKYIEEYWLYKETGHNYSIDIAFPDIKVGIEINGNQHYNKDGSLKEYYQKRHDIITKSGWKILEIHYTSCFNDNDIEKFIKFYKQPNYDIYFKEKSLRKTKRERIKENSIKYNKERIEFISTRKSIILNSDIDFRLYGSATKLSKLFNITPQKMRIWIKKYMY